MLLISVAQTVEFSCPQGNELAMLLAHFFASIFPETHCSIIPVMQEESVAQRHATRTINEPQTVEPHIAAGLEGRYIGNRSKQPQWDEVEKSRVPEVCLLQCRSGGPNLETTLQKAYVNIFFLVL
jgi:hypothetical protein